MIESGYFPPGAEFDSNAPYNQAIDDYKDRCPVCCSTNVFFAEAQEYEWLKRDYKKVVKLICRDCWHKTTV